ncbi:cyclopropane fatty acyl phospholipid synthase [Candidatus Dependentiae bacterium]
MVQNQTVDNQFFADLLAHADVALNGDRPWDIRVYDKNFFARVLRSPSMGLGESYMQGWWDCNQVDEMISRIFRARLDEKVSGSFLSKVKFLKHVLFNMQSRSKAFEIGEKHYDIGNELYKNMLDKRMVYTCAFWKNATNLDEAQENKLELTCQKIGIKPGSKILDIGCGWGSFAKYAAERHGAHVVGITVSKEQVELGQKSCKGLPVEIRLQDYRDVNEKFDHIVSLGMLEHVGSKNYRTYMKMANRCLKDDGLFLLHTIGRKEPGKMDPWINRYIFPNAILPAMSEIAKAKEGLFVIEDVHNFSTDYDKTLMAWNENFENSWHTLAGQYDETFHRMWRFYLLSCAGAFRSRVNQLWQIVLSKHGVTGGYTSIR